LRGQDYNTSCDIYDPDFQFHNVQELSRMGNPMPGASAVSVLGVLQKILLLAITLILPPKFPISSWELWRAPKKEVLNKCSEEKDRLERLTESELEFFRFYTTPWLGKRTELPIQAIKMLKWKLEHEITQTDHLLKWSDDEEWTAKDLHSLACNIVKNLVEDRPPRNEDERLPIEQLTEELRRWMCTCVFACCYEYQDCYCMLKFSLAQAHPESDLFDIHKTEQFIEMRLRQPAIKMTAKMPWSSAMQFFMAFVGVGMSTSGILYKEIYGSIPHFWHWYERDYFVLTFRPVVLLPFMYCIVKGVVSQISWNKLTGNDSKKNWCRTKTFQWFRRSGGPFLKAADVPTFGLAILLICRLSFIPSILWWLVYSTVAMLICAALYALLVMMMMGTLVTSRPTAAGPYEPLLTTQETAPTETRAEKHSQVQRLAWLKNMCKDAVCNVLKAVSQIQCESEPQHMCKDWLTCHLRTVEASPLWALSSFLVSVKAVIATRLWLFAILTHPLPDTSRTYICSALKTDIVSLNGIRSLATLS
jgi:ferredoxin-thioredoxin reductase catalytic subunit